MYDPYAGFTKTTLPNGLQVYAAHWPDRAWQYVGFVIHSGCNADPEPLPGVAHFVEHLVSRNICVSHEALRDYFQAYGGGAMLGGTNYYRTSYDFAAPASLRILRTGLQYFEQMLCHAQLTREIEMQRKVIADELRRDFSADWRYESTMRMQRALYHGSALTRYPSWYGTKEAIAAISPVALQDYYDAAYHPANMSIVTIGGMAHKPMLDLIAESAFGFSARRSRPRSHQFGTIGEPSENYVELQLRDVIKDPAAASYLSAWTVPGTYMPHINIANEMLEHVLFREIRENRGWAYDVNVSHNFFGPVIHVEIRIHTLAPEHAHNIEPLVEQLALQASQDQLLFEKIQSRKIARFSMEDCSGYKTLSNAMNDVGRYQRIVTLDQEIDLYRSLSFTDIKMVFGLMQPKGRWTYLCIP